MTAGREDRAAALLARLVALAPQVFPGLRVEEEWKAAVEEARQVVKGKGT